MLQVYKFLSERYPLSSCNYLKVRSNSRVRGHCKRLVKCFARLGISKFSFSHRLVVNEWNSLPEWVVNSTSVHCKLRLTCSDFFQNFRLTKPALFSGDILGKVAGQVFNATLCPRLMTNYLSPENSYSTFSDEQRNPKHTCSQLSND
ncbi:hypothetical protein HOLleu_39201 [Holothuria leucospilota]|uniref:Uncharacterized protein n=1 Tax=Holothuria leucospilota TaxID=206669 RepID=A0A9Q0YFN9_HOLLE|nr:hypothetical protein HOLleu_39201 [Holothuria leucospilota]